MSAIVSPPPGPSGGITSRSRALIQGACSVTDADVTQYAGCNNGTCGSSGCVFSEWGAWGPCSAPCGTGYALRTKALLSGPTTCGVPVSYQTCITAVCNRDCVVSDWGQWSSCDSCSATLSTRSRYGQPLNRR